MRLAQALLMKPAGPSFTEPYFTAATQTSALGSLTGFGASGGRANAIYSASPFGTFTGDGSADGGTITDIFFNDALGDHELGVQSGSQSLSNINIDGTDYSLSFNRTQAGVDAYNFGPASSLFSDGETYEITVT